MTGDLNKLTPELRKALQSELAPGERVLYASQPNWRAEWGKLAAIFLFGIFWMSISSVFFGLSTASLLGLHPMLSDGKPSSLGLQIFVFLFSLPFVAIGLLFLAAPFLGIKKSRRTVHVVTGARVLNVTTGYDKGAESYPLHTVNFVKRRDRKNGTGNLQIGYGVEKDSGGDPRPLTLDWPGIVDVKRAETLIIESKRVVR